MTSITYAIDDRYKNELKQILCEIYQNSLIPDQRLSEFKILYSNISNHIKQRYQHLDVCIFGSHVTGLANRNSDLDISILTHDNHHLNIQTKNINLVSKLKKFFDYLHSMKTILDIEPIFDAKVSIVTFTTRNNISGDISANNINGIDKTLLIKQYCGLNPKILIMGKLIKHFIEFYDIADASKGTMTSLAYIVMLIHFLQQKYNLQILPIKQHSENPSRSTFENHIWPIHNLPKFNEVCELRDQLPPVVDLWIGFFNYYTSEFDDSREVVNITNKQNMYRSTKVTWQNAFLAIEDPILPSINFGEKLNRANYLKIKDAFSDVLKNKGKLKK